MEYTWNALREGEFHSNLGSYGIVILNRPIIISPKQMAPLWESAAWRITADGGTDEWFNYIKKYNLNVSSPNQVTGDFDSIKPETLEQCKNDNSISVVPTPDEDYTDFTKSVQTLIDTCDKNKLQLDCFIAIIDHSGRLDQIFSNINTIGRFKIPGYILTGDSLTWLLSPGTHHITIPEYLRDKNEVCGILPFQPAKVKTEGLKWNLDNWKVEFGGLISSSNTYDGSPEVTITTDGTIIWTMSLGGKFCDEDSF